MQTFNITEPSRDLHIDEYYLLERLAGIDSDGVAEWRITTDDRALQYSVPVPLRWLDDVSDDGDDDVVVTVEQPFVRPHTTYEVSISCIPYFHRESGVVDESRAIGFWSKAARRNVTTASDGECATSPPPVTVRVQRHHRQ